MIDSHTILIVTTTIDAKEKANDLAEQLVQAKLVACAQVYPIDSHYTWQEKTMKEKEYLIQGKTLDSLFPAITKWMKENHPYEVPELVATPVAYVSNDYAEWVIKNCKNPDTPSDTEGER